MKNRIKALPLFLLAFVATLSAQTNIGPVNTPQINTTLFVGMVSGFYPTIQSAVTKGCTMAKAVINIPAGATPGDTIGAATGGCSTAWIVDDRSLPTACYTWSGSAYTAASCGAGGGGSGTGFPVVSDNFTLPSGVDSSGNYTPAAISATQTLFPSDPGGVSQGSTALNISYNDWNPCWNYGVPGNFPTDDYGWCGQAAGSFFMDSKSGGIHELMQLSGSFTGPGDINFDNLTANVRPVNQDGSGESYHITRRDTEEMREYQATIVTGGANAATLAVTCTANCPQLNSGTGFWQGGTMGHSSPLIDLNTRTPCTLSGVTVAGYSGIGLATTSCTVPVSTTGTLAANALAPRVVGNSTLQLSHRTLTVNLNTTTDLSIAHAAIAILPDPSGEPNFIEVVKPTAYGSFSGTQQTITAVFYYSHTSGTKFFAGGAAGEYFEMYQPAWIASHAYQVGNYIVDSNDHVQRVTTAGTSASSVPTWNTSGGSTTDGTSIRHDDGLVQQRYVQMIFGSPTANTIWFGYQQPAGASAILLNGAGAIYQGAEIVGVVNPSNSQPDGTYLALGGNAGAWTAGHVVENTDAISGHYDVQFELGNIYNIFTGVRPEFENVMGLTFSTQVHEFFDPFPVGDFMGAGGPFPAPGGFYYEGAFSTFYASQYAPLGASGQSGGLNAPNCGGSILCIGNGPMPGATSTLMFIYRSGDSGDQLTLDHATDIWNIQGAGFTFNGNQILTTASPVNLLQGDWAPTTAGGYACMKNLTSSTCTNGLTNNNYHQNGFVFDTLNQWLGGQYGTEAKISITAETPGTPGVLGEIDMYGYGFTGLGGTANGTIAMHGLNSGQLFIVDSGGGHGGNFGFNYALGTDILYTVDVNGIFRAQNATLFGATPTVGAGGLGLGGTTAAASACGSLVTAAGCLVVNIGGSVRNIPYY